MKSFSEAFETWKWTCDLRQYLVVKTCRLLFVALKVYFVALQVYLCGASSSLCGALRHLCGAQNILCGAQIYTLWRSKIYLNFQKISFKNFSKKTLCIVGPKEPFSWHVFWKNFVLKCYLKKEKTLPWVFFETTTGFSRNPFKNISFIFLWHLRGTHTFQITFHQKYFIHIFVATTEFSKKFFQKYFIHIFVAPMNCELKNGVPYLIYFMGLRNPYAYLLL